jgi:Orsellinic acid/F9775 biosynthesis cluster protein D
LIAVALEIIDEKGIFKVRRSEFAYTTGEKIFTSNTMTRQDLKPYITHLPASRVVVCNPCGACIPPNKPIDHYKGNHTAKKAHPISTEVRQKLADYMGMLDLCDPDKVIPPYARVPELKIIPDGYVCKYPGCHDCGTTPGSMRQHYYVHQDHVPIDFVGWESTALQTFFDGRNKKYDNPYLC